MPLRGFRARPRVSAQTHIQRSELERQIHLVTDGARKIVDQDPIAGLDEDDPAAMDDRVREGQVAVMLGVEEIELRGRVPFPETDARLALPTERTGGLRLADAIDDDRAVGGGAPEEIT